MQWAGLCECERTTGIINMHIQTLPLTTLTPAPYNPRITLTPGSPAYERLKRSLDEFELVQPFVWNRRTGHLVGGHQRLSILKEQGITECECVVVDLSPADEKALNIALNNQRLAGDWDAEKLIDVVAELTGIADFDATLTGFNDQELADLLFVGDPEFTPAEPDDAATSSDHIRVMLDVPPDVWDAVQRDIDTLLSTHPGVRVHVINPPT